MNLQVLTRNVVQIARQAGDYLLREQRRIPEGEVELKAQGDFVSRADRDAEQIITESLLALLPGSVVMAEEGSPEERGGQWRWIVDPLDGTTNYLHGFPFYAVSIALEDRRAHPEHFGQRVIGVVHQPSLGATYDAFAGGGARKNGQWLRVRRNRDLSRALMATAFPFKQRELVAPFQELFNDLYPRISDIRRIGSAASDLAWVAEGVLDGYFEIGLSPWDLAAGALLVEEAGGTVTDWWGRDVLETGWVNAGNRVAYDAVFDAVGRTTFQPPDKRWR